MIVRKLYERGQSKKSSKSDYMNSKTMMDCYPKLSLISIYYYIKNILYHFFKRVVNKMGYKEGFIEVNQ